MKRYIIILLLLVLLSGCAAATAEAPATTAPTQTAGEPLPTEPPDPIRQQIATMTLEEKVWQLFMIQPESLDITTDPSSLTPELLSQYPVGGFLITGDNISGAEQIRQFTAAIRENCKIPTSSSC